VSSRGAADPADPFDRRPPVTYVISRTRFPASLSGDALQACAQLS